MVRGGLVSGCDSEQRRFAEGHAEEIDADGQLGLDRADQARPAGRGLITDAIEDVRREARGNRDRGETERTK